MSEERAIALDQLLIRALPIAAAVAQLSRFGWDCEVPLRELRPHLAAVLKDAEAGRVSLAELAEWANAVEGRDDLAYEQPVNDILFELAHPEINGEPTPHRLVELLNMLNT